MNQPAEGIQIESRRSVFQAPITVDLAGFFSGLAKATTFGLAGAYDESMAGVVESLATFGLAETNEQLAGLLIRRSIAVGIREQLRPYLRDFTEVLPTGIEALCNRLENQICKKGFTLEAGFFSAPQRHELVKCVESALETWLGFRKVGALNAKTISSRFPDYFVWGLHLELQSQKYDYSTLIAAIDTPAAEAWRRIRTWDSYRRDLKRQLAEPVFGESFSLSQIFVWPNAYTE